MSLILKVTLPSAAISNWAFSILALAGSSTLLEKYRVPLGMLGKVSPANQIHLALSKGAGTGGSERNWSKPIQEPRQSSFRNKPIDQSAGSLQDETLPSTSHTLNFQWQTCPELNGCPP